MPFIPGKLKPRIKPRLGARITAAVENKTEDPKTNVELSISKPVQDVCSGGSLSSSPSVSETNSQQEECSTRVTIDEAKSETKSSQSDGETLAGENSIDLKCDKDVEANGVICNSVTAERSFSMVDAKHPHPVLPTGSSKDSNKQGSEILSGKPSNAPLVEGKVIEATEQTLPAETPSVDDSLKLQTFIHEPSSINETVQKSIPKNSRPIGLTFHKPNLKRLARPDATSCPSQIEQLVLGTDATPKPSVTTEDSKNESGDEGLVYRVSSDVQRDATSDTAGTLIQVPDVSPEKNFNTVEEFPATNSPGSKTSDGSCEKITSIEESSLGASVRNVPDTSETDECMQPININYSSDSVKSTNSENEAVFKKPPKMFKRAPTLKSDRVKPGVDTLKTVVSSAVVESERLKMSEVSTASTENAGAENIAVESLPNVDPEMDRNSSPLSAVNVNTKKSASAYSKKKDQPGSNSRDLVKPMDVPKAAPFSKTGKSTKGETDDVRVLFAISAVDYLKRHDHALGDSILRRFIIGDKNMENRSRKSTMCSTCNPQTLKKCLSSLWSFDKNELQTIIKKAGERQKAPVSYAALPGKTLFKPSLGRQRAPTLTASTYGKMSFEVKERLAKQYGPNPPQLNKLRMLDLIFYNPSDNPMSQPSKKPDQKSISENDPDGRKSEVHNAGQTKGSDSESDPDDPSEEKDPNATNDGKRETSGQAVPVPQVRIGDDGQIILARESLVMKKKEREVISSSVVEEYSFADSNKKKVSLDRTAWSFEETLQFYKALHSLGTDFSMMIEMFPKRTRANLKSKFKREERKNPALIDKVLAAQGQTLNFTDVEKDLAADKTLRRLGLEYTGPHVSRKNAEKKALEKAGMIENKRKSSTPRSSLTSVNGCKKGGNEGQSTTSNSEEELKTSSRDASENEEDAIFKRPSNIRPPRKRKLVKSVPAVPEKRKKDSSGGKVSKGASDQGDDAVFKKPRIPKKRKVPRAPKRSNSPAPVQHLLSISLNEEEEESDDTDDSASLDGTEGECLIIKTDIKGDNYSYSRSVRVNYADPEVPLDVNETIEHDRPRTPMSDADMEAGSDSEAGEDFEVVSIDVDEIASYLEKTGAVVIESLQTDDLKDQRHGPVTAEGPLTISEVPLTHESTAT